MRITIRPDGRLGAHRSFGPQVLPTVPIADPRGRRFSFRKTLTAIGRLTSAADE